MAFEKGNKLGGRKPGSKNNTTKLKSFRKDLSEMRFSVAREMADLYRKTKDEMLKMELLKLMLEYSQTKPTTDLDEEESADVTNISEATLLKLASGDTVNPPDSIADEPAEDDESEVTDVCDSQELSEVPSD